MKDCYQVAIKESVKKFFALEPQVKSPKVIIRYPYVLEFLGLSGQHSFVENDLKNALIEHLQKFLLGSGRSFTFVARQKRITFEGSQFRLFVDSLTSYSVNKSKIVLSLWLF